MALYEIHFTYNGDKRVYCHNFDGEPEPSQRDQALIEHIGLEVPSGALSHADVLETHGVANVWHQPAP